MHSAKTKTNEIDVRNTMKQDLISRIQALKTQKNAVILAHYYTSGEVQAIADYVGDSFYLAKVAKTCSADVIVFAGVGFMGESAKILNPEKTVLMPDPAADCPMAHMVAPSRIDALRAEYPDLAVVCYINSTAALKCQSDVCVTSSNAVKIVRALENEHIFFIPDENLGRFVAEQVPEKHVILNDGFCPVHAEISLEELLAEKKAHPAAPVLSHPECRAEILAHSDFLGSTAEIIAYAKASDADEFIICTEDGVEFRLAADNPQKRFYFCQKRPCCTDMKRNTLEKILHVLQTGENEITVDANTRAHALLPLERMLELAGS